jgi:hypothetical protein
MIEEFPSFVQHISNSIIRAMLELLAEYIIGRNSERNVTRRPKIYGATTITEILERKYEYI